GLDAGYWMPKVMQILGIKCREALQHLEYKDYLRLECEVLHPWEKKALQKLLKRTDYKTCEELQKHNSEKTKQRQELAKQALKDLTEMLNSCSHSQDAVREKAETLWQAMEIPKEFWPPPKKPLADILESIQKQLEQQEVSAVRREKIPDMEVLRRASGGLALQGIYRTSRPEDVLAKREQLLRVPEGFQLAGPEQGSLLERKEFSTSAAESTFTKSMEQLGFSISVSAKANFWGINLGAGVDHSSSSQSQDTHQSHSEQSYFCTTMYQYIPLASCYFQRHQLRLSDAALQELQDMEQLLSFTQEDKAPLLNRCERFFSRFGSHVNQGPLHFGGIFWWKAFTEGFQSEQREERKRQTSEALNSFVGASWGGFGVSAAGALDVSESSSKASVLGRAGDSSHTAIQLYVINTGGPPDTASLPQWKTGLVSDNTTWCLIDRGFELIPVWDIILWNHFRDFKSVGQMSRALRAAYKDLTNQSVGFIFGKEIEIAVEEAKAFMETVKTWEVMVDERKKVDERKLLMLMELKDDLNAKTRNPSVWINVCLSDKALQSLQERAQKDMELLVLLIATSTGYQVESSTFQHLLGHPEIQYMAKEMEEAHKEYMNLKEQDADRAEASLLLMGLTVTPESQELSPEQKRERLVFMEDHMKGLLSPRIKNLLQKHRGGPDWERLERDLNSLISGCLNEKWDEQRMQKILKDFEDTFPAPELPSQSKLNSDSSQSKASEAIANQEFLQLLKRLGLKSHYPKKMGMGDFQLPCYFLQKLLTVDYQVRYLTCWDDSN
ncbi:GVIN1 GTPase, partial [Hippolais icterina]|nr:GVIN1 GTPase [Hippolais icterina]